MLTIITITLLLVNVRTRAHFAVNKRTLRIIISLEVNKRTIRILNLNKNKKFSILNEK